MILWPGRMLEQISSPGTGSDALQYIFSGQYIFMKDDVWLGGVHWNNPNRWLAINIA